MDNQLKKEKLKRFVADKAMFESVKETMTSSFLKPLPNKDIQFLAASRIAIDLLNDALRDIEILAKREENEEKPPINYV